MGVFKSIGKAAGGRIKQTIDLVERAFISRPSHMMVCNTSGFEVFSSQSQLDTLATDLRMNANVKTLLGNLLADALKGGVDAEYHSPPVTAVGFPALNLEGNRISKTQLRQMSLEDLQSGLLSQIVVYFDEQGIRGIQQYFGTAPGTYLGTYGNMQEASFPISYNDPLIRIFTQYSFSDSVPYLRGVRFVTAGGTDSGWLGQDVSGQQKNYYINVNEYSTAENGGMVWYPIYAIDAFMIYPDIPSFPQALLTRHCPPFDVALDLGETVGQDCPDAGDDPAGSDTPDDSLDLQWDYNNQLQTDQTVQVRDVVTLANSHTITITDTSSVSRSFGVSLSGKMLTEGGFMSGSASANASSSIVTTQADSTSVTQTEEREVDFPLIVPAGTRVRATLHTQHTTESSTGKVRIQYKGKMADGTNAPYSEDTTAAIEYCVKLFGVNTLQNTVTVEKVD